MTIYCKLDNKKLKQFIIHKETLHFIHIQKYNIQYTYILTTLFIHTCIIYIKKKNSVQR